ncbi:MAG: hypothetical protein AB1817_03285 [Chloroflexota bacterium]
MDYGKILARSFEITRKYRALWLFGILLALFGGSSGGSFNFPSGGSGSRGTGRSDFPTLPTVSSETWQLITILIAALVCFALVWILLGIILRFVSRAALIGLVQELEAHEKTPTVRRGFSIGAEHFWRLLGIALVINIPLTVVSFVIILLAALPLILALMPLISAGRTAPSELIAVAVAGSIGSVALICCAALILIAVSFVIHPFYEFIVRTCVVKKSGVMDSIREGYRIVRANLGNVAVLYILAIGIGIGFGLLMIPIVLIAIAIPAGVAFLVYWLANSITGAIVAGVVLGIPALLLLLFISGLYHTFESTYWTEGYLTATTPTKVEG